MLDKRPARAPVKKAFTPQQGTGTINPLPIRVVKPSSISVKVETSSGPERGCQRCPAFHQAKSRAADTFQPAIVSSR